MKRNNSPLSRIFAFLPGVVVLMSVVPLLMLIAYPKFQIIGKDRLKEAELRREVADLTQKTNVLASVDDSTLAQLQAKAEISLPREKTFSGLLTGLDALSKEAGSTLVTFGSSPGLISTGAGQLKETIETDPIASNTSGLKYLSALIGLNSNTSSLISLSTKLASSGRLVTLQKIAYSTSSNSPTVVNTNILLRVYYQPVDALSTPLEKVAIVPLSESEKELIAKVDSLNRFTLEVPVNLPSNLDPFLTPQTATNSPSPRI